jgi:ketosteroid isomerase-like protein
MNANTKAVGLSFLLVALTFLSVDALAADGATDVAAMQAVDQSWLKAYNAGDANAIAGLYDEKAILMPPGAPAARGRASIRLFLASDMAASKKVGAVFHLGAKSDGGVNGDMGWMSGTYSVTDASGKVIDNGKYLSVSKKEGGKWLYVRDTWNSDSTTPAEASSTPKQK